MQSLNDVLTFRILINSRENSCKRWRRSKTLLLHPAEKAADTPLNLGQMTGGDVA